jgi:sugar-specific transcriptional regulator TrmB
METSILEDLGLSTTEIKVYLALLELGNAGAKDILERAKIHNSALHFSLNSLIEKGLISYVLEGRRRLYQASDPEHFDRYIDLKKDRFHSILPELKARQSFVKNYEPATIYKGVRGITEVYHKLISLDEKEYLTFGGGPPTVEVMGIHFWMNMHRRRIENKLPSRQLFDLSVKHIAGSDIERLPFTNIRYLSADFAQFQETVIVGDYVAINVFTKDPYAFLIKDPSVAVGYRKYFEMLWDRAEEGRSPLRSSSSQRNNAPVKNQPQTM